MENPAGMRIGVLVSGQGRGSNMQAIIDGCAPGIIRGMVAIVVGARSDSPAMERARSAGVHTVTISPKKYEGDDAAYGDALLSGLNKYGVDLVCLAGYMRMLPVAVVNAYKHAVMNVHPALLPLFGGKGMYGEHVHRAVLESGMKVSGCTVHFVDYEYDTGPIILQRCIPVEEGDTPETLAARVLPAEHAAYVDAVRLASEGRLMVEGSRVRVMPEAA